MFRLKVQIDCTSFWGFPLVLTIHSLLSSSRTFLQDGKIGQELYIDESDYTKVTDSGKVAIGYIAGTDATNAEDNFIGALIGGAIGNRLGEGGGKSGATALGALIGSEVVRNDNAEANQNFV